MSENVLITSMRQQLNDKLSNIISEFRKKYNDDNEILLDRQFEEDLTSLALKTDNIYLKIDDKKSNFPYDLVIYNLFSNDMETENPDYLILFCYVFILYTRLRRDGMYEKLSTLINRDLYRNELQSKFTNQSLFKHMEYMCEGFTKPLSLDLINKCQVLAENNPKQTGFVNHFAGLVAEYYSYHLDDAMAAFKIKKRRRIFFKKDDNETYVKLKNDNKKYDIEFCDQLQVATKLMEDVVKSSDYDKFYATLGRLKALTSDYDVSRELINKAISKAPDGDDRKSRVAVYKDYLSEIALIKAYYDTKVELWNVKVTEESIRNEKVTNICYISIFSAIVSFFTASITSFSELSNYKELALTLSLLALSYTFIISIILLFMLLTTNKKFKTNYLSYLLVFVLLLGSFIGFILILVL